ncbi:hypothetical protein DIRU0_D08416 [Diutina rugosa]
MNRSRVATPHGFAAVLGLLRVQAVVTSQPFPQTIIVVGGLTHHFASLCTAAFIIGGFQVLIDP